MKTYVITLAPPRLPFPLLAIAIRILKQLLPMGVPLSGSSMIVSISAEYSFFRDGNFFINRFNSFSNLRVGKILKFMQQLLRSL